MSRTLFIGCSHSMGYQGFLKGNNKEESSQPNTWGSNNYAEFYSKNNNKKCVVMASAGTGNRVYPRFLAHAFKTYDDIDEVFIQSTYWGRFPIVINPDLDPTKIFPTDFFLQKDSTDELVDRWSIALSVDNKYLEHYHKPQPQDWEMFPYNRETAPWVAEPDTRRSSHLYFQMWHYQNTHLEQEDYFKDIAVCDMICNNNNVPMYVWNINNRCFIPQETDNYYTKLNKTTFAKQDAEIFFNKKFETLDGEHYTEEVHKQIAEQYIPYLKEKT